MGPVRVAMTTDGDLNAPRPGPVLLHPRLLLGVQPCEDPTPWTGIAWTDVTQPRSASAGDVAAEFYAKVAAAMAQAAPAESTRGKKGKKGKKKKPMGGMWGAAKRGMGLKKGEGGDPAGDMDWTARGISPAGAFLALAPDGSLRGTVRCPPGKDPEGENKNTAVAYDAFMEPAEDLAGLAAAAVKAGDAKLWPSARGEWLAVTSETPGQPITLVDLGAVGSPPGRPRSVPPVPSSSGQLDKFVPGDAVASARPSDDGHALWAVTRSGGTWLWGVPKGGRDRKAAWRPLPKAPGSNSSSEFPTPGRKPSVVDVDASSFIWGDPSASGGGRGLAQARVDIDRVYPEGGDASGGDESTDGGGGVDHAGFELRVAAFTQPFADGFASDGTPLGNLSMVAAAEPALSDARVVKTTLRFAFADDGGWEVAERDEKKGGESGADESGLNWHPATASSGAALRASQALSETSMDLDATVAQSRVMARKCKVSATAWSPDGSYLAVAIEGGANPGGDANRRDPNDSLASASTTSSRATAAAVLVFSGADLSLRSVTPWSEDDAHPSALAWSLSGKTVLILAADGKATAIAPDGTHRPLKPPGVVGGGEGDHASSHSLPWARWRNGGRGDMAVESEGISEDLRKSLFKPAPAFRLPTSAFAASACADPCGGDDAGVGGFALSDGGRVAVFAVEETTFAPESKPAPEDTKAESPVPAPVPDAKPEAGDAPAREAVDTVAKEPKMTKQDIVAPPPEPAPVTMAETPPANDPVGESVEVKSGADVDEKRAPEKKKTPAAPAEKTPPAPEQSKEPVAEVKPRDEAKPAPAYDPITAPTLRAKLAAAHASAQSTAPEKTSAALELSSRKNPEPSKAETASVRNAQRIAFSSLLTAADRAFMEGRKSDAVHLYHDAACEDPMGYPPLVAVMVHSGDLSGAVGALRAAFAAAAGTRNDGEYPATERGMASELSRLVAEAVASGKDRRPLLEGRSTLGFPSPVGWFPAVSGGGADRRPMSPSRQPLEPGAAVEIMDAAVPALSVGLALRGYAKGAKEGVDAAMRAMTVCGLGDGDGSGWRRSVRAAAAVGRAVHPTRPDASIRANAVAADVLLARLRDIAAEFPVADAKSGKSRIRFSREQMSSVLEIASEADWVFAESAGAAEARASVVSAAADLCADVVVACVSKLAPPTSVTSPRRGSDSDRKEAPWRDGLAAGLETLVATVAGGGEATAEAAHGAISRAADACWALQCRDMYTATAKEHSKVTEVNAAPAKLDADLARRCVNLAAAVSPSNAFGWEPETILAQSLGSCASISGVVSPELLAAMTELVPRSAGASLRQPLARLRQRVGAGWSEETQGNLARVMLDAAGRERSKYIAKVADCLHALASERVEDRLSGSLASAPVGPVKDAVSKNMGQPARRSVIFDRPSPPDEPASVVWARGEFTETVEDPLGGVGDPLPRLLGVEKDPRWSAKLVPRGEVKTTTPGQMSDPGADRGVAFGSPDVSVNVTRGSVDDPSSVNATAGSHFGVPSPSGAHPDSEPEPAQQSDPALEKVRAESAEIQAKISQLRTSVETQRKVSAAALRESLSKSKEKIAAAGKVPIDAPDVRANRGDSTNGGNVGSFDESSIAHVASLGGDPNTSVVEKGNWKMLLPAKLTASAVPGEAPPANTSSSTSDDKTSSTDKSASPSVSSGSDQPLADDSRSTDVAPDPSPIAHVSEPHAATKRSRKKKKAGKVRFMDEEQAVAAEVKARRKASKAAAAVTKAAAMPEVKYLYRGNKPSFTGPDPLPVTATSGRTRVPHAVMYPGREGDGAEPKPEQKIPARVVPLMTVYDKRREALLRGTSSGPARDGREATTGTHLRLFTREAMRQAAVAALEQQKEEDREEWEEWEARQLAREARRTGKVTSDLDTTTRIAEAAAAAAMGDTEARLTQVLASASQDQLAKMERAIRAARGSNATPLKQRGSGTGHPKTVLEEYAEHLDADVPFTVEAALKYFEPSSPIHTDAVMHAAKEAAEESAKLGPSAQEMYYASYKAAMESATSQISDDFNTAAVLAAAAGAARSARAHAMGATSLRTHEGLASHGVPASLKSRDRIGRLLARRRAAAKDADVSGAAKVGVFKGTEGAGRVLASVNEAEKSLEYREGGPLKGKAKQAYRAGFENAMRDAGVAATPGSSGKPPRTPGSSGGSGGIKKTPPFRVAIPKLAIKGSPADLELHGGGGMMAPLAPRAPISRGDDSPTRDGGASGGAENDDDDYTSSDDFSSSDDDIGETTLGHAAGLDTTAAQEAAVASIEAAARDAAEADAVVAAVGSLEGDALDAREAARQSAEGILSGDVLDSYLAGVESSTRGLPPPLPPLDGSSPLQAHGPTPSAGRRVTFEPEVTPARNRIAIVDEGDEVPTPATPGSSGGSDKLRAARERRKMQSAQKQAKPFSPHTETRAAEAERELSAAIAMEAPKDPFAEGGEWWWTLQSARERAVMFAGSAPSAPSDRSSNRSKGSNKQLRQKELSDAEQRTLEAEKRLARKDAELAKKMSAAEKKRTEESRKVLEGFREVSQALKALEMDADVLEIDLSESSATMAAIESARNERSLAQMAQMARDARTIREKAKEEDEAVDAAVKEMTRQKVERVRGLDYSNFY